MKEAKSNSVPKDVIQRAIDKSQAGGGDDYEEIRTVVELAATLLGTTTSGLDRAMWRYATAKKKGS